MKPKQLKTFILCIFEVIAYRYLSKTENTAFSLAAKLKSPPLFLEELVNLILLQKQKTN